MAVQTPVLNRRGRAGRRVPDRSSATRAGRIDLHHSTPEGSPMTNGRFEATALITAVPGRDADLRNRLGELVAKTVTEPGCIRFEIFEVVGSPGRFVLWEVFRDADALQQHMAADYTQAYFASGLTAETEVIHQRLLATT
jgi:quinol monooxygenase YgiN